MSGSRPDLWSGTPASRILVLGVEPGQDPSIARGAAGLAGMLDAGLACVWVDPSRVSVGTGVGAAVETTLVDPDSAGDLGAQGLHAADLLERLGRVLDVQPVAWRFLCRTGDVARALAEVAEGLVHTQDRAVIVVPAARPAR